MPRPRRRLGPAQALLQKLRCHNIVMHAPADAAPRFTRGVFLGKRIALPSMSNGVTTLPAAVCTAVISIIDEALFSMESSAARGSAKEVLTAREILVARATQQLGSPPIVSLDALAAMDLDARTYVLALAKLAKEGRLGRGNHIDGQTVSREAPTEEMGQGAGMRKLLSDAHAARRAAAESCDASPVFVPFSELGLPESYFGTGPESLQHMVLTLLGLEERGPQCGGERPSADPVQKESAALREHYARLITGKPDKSDKRNRDGGEGLPLPSPLALSPCPLPSPSPLALSPPPKRPTLNVPNSAHFYFLHHYFQPPSTGY